MEFQNEINRKEKLRAILIKYFTTECVMFWMCSLTDKNIDEWIEGKIESLLVELKESEKREREFYKDLGGSAPNFAHATHMHQKQIRDCSRLLSELLDD